MSRTLHCPALIAVECETPIAPLQTLTDPETAAAIADAIGTDLMSHFSDIGGLDFALAGALFDQAQMLRPQWPLHIALADMLERLPRKPDGSHLVAIGACAGKMPVVALQPETDLLGSPMLVLPWLVAGPAHAVAEVGQRFERELLENGLIGAELALAVGEAFGVKTAHARHMTILDLCALASAQYGHAGLSDVWQIIETALLRPDQECTVRLGDDSSLRYSRGAVGSTGMNRTRLAQCRAILAAHGLTLVDREATH